jgi:chemotaxis signal transduction protein
VARTLALRSGEHYAVSAFEPTPLYADAATLIYTAAVQRPGGGKALGGIAIVFDSTPQFAAILTDSLPADEAGTPLPGSFALFVGSDGRIVASSDPRFPIGTASPVALDEAGLAAHGELTCLSLLDGKHVAIGAALSKGYREYKTSDGHRADIVALCAMPLGDAAAAATTKPLAASTAAVSTHRPADGGETCEVATFHIGQHWLGVKARDVVEAVDASALRPSARQADDGLLAGYKLHQGRPVPVLRLARLLGIPDASSEQQQIVIIRAAGRDLGLVVDALGLIPEIAMSELQPLRDLTSKTDVPTLGVVATRNASGSAASMLTLLDVDRLGQRFVSERGDTFIRAAE